MLRVIVKKCMVLAKCRWRYNKERVVIMKEAIHPTYATVNVTCSCGHTFQTRSTLAKDLQIEVCAQCHPFYTGKQKLVDTGGRVQKFRDRYKSRDQAAKE